MNMQNQSEQHESGSAKTLSLGERFRQTRTVLNLSIDDVVAKTNLNASIIQRLENDGFDGNSVPAIFVNGYIRSYAQFLKMPEEYWKDVNLGEKIENDLNKNSRTGEVTNPYSSLGRWVGYLTVIVILVAAGMTALWWWENYQQSNTERDNLVQNYVPSEQKSVSEQTVSNTQAEQLQSAQTENTPAVNSADISDDLAKAEGAGVVVTPPTENTPPTTVEQPVETAATTASVAEPVAETVSTTPVTDTPVTSNITEATPPTVATSPEIDNSSVAQVGQSDRTDVPVVLQMPQENTAQAMLMQHTAQTLQSAVENSVENSVENQPVTAVDGDLQIEITGDSCWVTVRDGKRKPLAQKEYKKGEILTFNEGAPYSLTVGAPGNVKITYKGQPYPLKVDGRVARFKLE